MGRKKKEASPTPLYCPYYRVHGRLPTDITKALAHVFECRNEFMNRYPGDVNVFRCPLDEDHYFTCQERKLHLALHHHRAYDGIKLVVHQPKEIPIVLNRWIKAKGASLPLDVIPDDRNGSDSEDGGEYDEKVVKKRPADNEKGYSSASMSDTLLGCRAARSCSSDTSSSNAIVCRHHRRSQKTMSVGRRLRNKPSRNRN